MRIDAGAAAKFVCATMDSERALADRCLRGEKKAWLELLRLYDRKVLRVLFRSGVREELDDLRQEVWARLLAREHVLVVQHDGARAGLVVDELFGAGQAVIKPLGNYFADVPGIAGSSILGNGRVALILDTATILRNLNQQENA